MPEFIVPNRNNSELARFASRYNLNADTFEMWHDVKDNRAVFPIQHEGIIVDAIGRSLKNKLPKENNLETTIKRHHNLKHFFKYG